MKPGDVIPSWSEDGNGYAIVTRTSRHRRTIDDTTARETLLTEAVLGVIGRVEDLTPWRAALEHATTCTWRSVTKREVETGLEPDDGGA